MRLATTLFSVLSLFLAVPAFGQADDWKADVDSFARCLVDAGLVPGMGIAITRGDSVVYTAGFGLADKETGRTVDEGTAFYIASSTKALTATAVVLLAERGELDLEAPVTRYIPGVRFEAPIDADSVTIEALLTMTEGLQDGGPVVFRTAFTGDFRAGQLVELLAGYGPSESGHAFSYGNLPYNILGLVLSPQDGHGWKDVIRREVLEPLGMDDTSARISDFEPDAVARPHAIRPDEGWQPVRLAKADENMHAAGGHFTSARDLGRFVAAHLGDGSVGGERVFPTGVLASAHRKHVDQDREFGPFHRYGWGYGGIWGPSKATRSSTGSGRCRSRTRLRRTPAPTSVWRSDGWNGGWSATASRSRWGSRRARPRSTRRPRISSESS
jgi:CubicO group peptidase (beta-lactamase class C family)